jgi:tetratricopeptide (TPR) repeat protein
LAARAPARAPAVIPLESTAADQELDRSARLGHRPWPLVLSTATVIGLASFWWLSSPPTAAPRATASEATAADPAQRYLDRADALFALQRTDKFDAALDEYMKALGFHESDAHILASIARVHAVWAQELRFGVEDERTPAAPESAQRAQWLNTQADLHAEQALRHAETAAQKNPTNVEAQVALADARRLTRDVRGAREELRRARAEERSPDAETLRVAALLAIAEANGDARAGRALAAQAASLAPDLLRVRLLLGRCALADGDLESARQIARELLARDAQLPGALALSQLVSRPSEPPAAEPAPRPAETDATGAAHAENLSHEGYITRGQSALESGQVSLAKRMFEQALFIRPSSAPAHTGLGYVALEKGRPQLAIEHFQAAARGGSDDAYIGLGEAYRRVGRNREALRAYQSYLSRSPSGDQLSIARAQVERLGEELGKARKQP